MQLIGLVFFTFMVNGQLAVGSQENLGQATVATRITMANVAQLQREGPDAIGGVDDWFLSNGTICAVISDVTHEGEFSSKGGSLIDLGFCGRADDHFSFTHDLLDGSRHRPLDATLIAIESNDGNASIVVHSEADGVRLTTRYYFDPQYKTQLQITKRYTRVAGASFNFISPLQFNYHSLEPFIFNSRNLKTTNGFQNEDFVKRGVKAIRKSARNADTLITVSPRDAKVAVAYGWQLLSAERVEDDVRYDVPFYMLADNDITAMMLLTDTFYLGKGKTIGLLQLPQIPLLKLDMGAALETHEVIYVAARGDVASVTDQLLVDSPTVIGSVSEVNSAIHIVQSNDAPLTHVIPNIDGTFSFKAPLGDYSIKVLAYGERSTELKFSVKSDTTNDLGKVILPEASKLKLPAGEPMRLVFVGIDGTPNPDFAGNLTEASVAFDEEIYIQDPISAIFMAGVNDDVSEVDIAPGTYEVYATKGPEFSLEKTSITLKEGENATLQINIPERVIETPDYIASDLHVHSGISFDSTFAETERVRTFVAEHGEVMIASEHEIPTNYAPYIQALGVEDKIVSIPAVELTSSLPTIKTRFAGGHFNFFPFQPEHHHYRNGMVPHEDQRLRDVIHSARERQPDTLIQLNHPRYDLSLSGEMLPDDWEDIVDYGNYLEHMGSAGYPYNPNKELHTHPNNVLIDAHPQTGVRDIDFDIIEVVNPGGGNHYDRLTAVRRDWLSFVKQGERIVGTANSDSHTPLEQVAIPRTMVLIKDDRVSHFKQPEFIANLKAGRAYGTTGPMVILSLSEAKMGDTFSGSAAPLSVSVNKAPWIKLERLEIQINGSTVVTKTLTDQTTQSFLVPLEFEKDSFVTIEVFGPATEDYSAIYPEISPYAFTNPIYVDFDQDGKWQAPGL